MLELIAIPPLGVIPVLIGPLQVLLAILPILLVSLASLVLSLFRPKTLKTLLHLCWRLKYLLIVIVALVLVGRGLARRMSPEPAVSGEPAAPAEWITARGTPARTGALTKEATGPLFPETSWRWQMDGVQILASPALGSNRLYLVTAEGIGAFDRTGRGSICAFSTEPPALLWRTTPEFETGARHYRATFSSPVIDGTYLVCGEGLHATPSCRIICLDMSVVPPRLAWSVETGNHVECTPVIGIVSLPDGTSEKRVFAGAGDDGGYYAVSLNTGEVRWHLPGERYPDAETALVYADDRVYAGLGKGGQALCVLDALDGTELARLETPYPVFAPPAIAGDLLYIGMGNGDFQSTAADLGLAPTGAVWCINRPIAESRGAEAIVWKLALPETVIGPIIIGEADMFVTTVGGHVFRCDRFTGRILAQRLLYEVVKAPAALSSEALFLATAGGDLLALDRHSLSVIWRQGFADPGLNVSGPVIAGDGLWIGSGGSGLVNLTTRGDAGETGRSGPPSVGTRGILELCIPDTARPRRHEDIVAGAPALGDDLVVVPVARSTEELPAGITAYDREKLEPLWSAALSNGVWQTPTLHDEAITAVHGVPGEQAELVQLNRDSGAVIKRIEVGPAKLLGACRGLSVLGRGEEFLAYGQELSAAWRYQCPSRPTAVSISGDLLLALFDDSPRAIALDIPSGQKVMDVGLPSKPVTGPIVKGTRLFLGTENGVAAISMIDGSPDAAWRAKRCRVAEGTSLVSSIDRLACVSAAGTIEVLSLSDGSAVASIPGVSTTTSPVFTRDGLVFLSSDNRIIEARLPTSTQHESSLRTWNGDLSLLSGSPSGPITVTEQHVLVPWPHWGLLVFRGMDGGK